MLQVQRGEGGTRRHKLTGGGGIYMSITYTADYKRPSYIPRIKQKGLYKRHIILVLLSHKTHINRYRGLDDPKTSVKSLA